MHNFPELDNSGETRLAEEPSQTNPEQESGHHPFAQNVAQAPSFESNSFEPFNFDSDKFTFSAEQLTCPVVIEIFCGSSRVTACLKLLGLQSSFGVDHNVNKATATANELDLTLKEHQDVLFLWMKSPLVVGIFIAPPCGTCSLARNIQLRNPQGKPIQGPRPLRSALHPQGLPNLTKTENARVSAANKLYEFVATLILFAHERGLIAVVENPRSSLFWLTRFWKSVSHLMRYTAHQACAYQGCRPKWAVLAWNHSVFSSICKTCPGESPQHFHKPWGLMPSSEGLRFSTSEETAYPKPLAMAIAQAFAAVLSHAGWSPPADQFSVPSEPNLKFMRAIATTQPKAAQIPPVVREHKQVVLVRGPVKLLQQIAIQPMTRLKVALQVPDPCTASLQFLPIGAQMLRTTSLRSKGDILQKELHTQTISGEPMAEQAWGIPFSPEEFISEAVDKGHPKAVSNLVPNMLMSAVDRNFGRNCDVGALARERADWFAKWTKRASELSKSELDFKMQLYEHVRNILAPKRLLLWKEILTELQYPDLGVFEELTLGTQLVGVVPTCGLFEKKFKNAELTVQQLEAMSSADKRKNFHTCSSSGDDEVDRIVYEKTLEEVASGWAAGPFRYDDLPEGAVLSRRFGLKQPGRVLSRSESTIFEKTWQNFREPTNLNKFCNSGIKTSRVKHG